MQTLLSNIILPMPVFWIILGVAFIFYWRRKKKVSRYMAFIALLWLLLVSTPFIPNLLVKNLEGRYEVFSENALNNTGKPVHILVLGCGHTSDLRLPANNQLSVAALGRLAEGIRLQRRIPGSMIITSGSRGKEEKPQATVLAEAAILLGVEPQHIMQQTLPENTWQEATEYKRIFGDSAQLILVTNAVHMPRAMYSFHQAGLDPIPAPTNHFIKKGSKRNFRSWIPAACNISKMGKAIHEYAGMLWYKLEE